MHNFNLPSHKTYKTHKNHKTHPPHLPIPLVFTLALIILTLPQCNKQDWDAYNDLNPSISSLCDRQSIANEKNKVNNIFLDKTPQTLKGKKIPDVYDPKDYPGFNPVIKWNSTLNTQERENIKIALIKTKIITHLDSFYIGVYYHALKYPFKITYLLNGPDGKKHPNTPIFPTQPKEIIQKIYDFKYPIYAEYVDKTVEKATVIEKTNLSNHFIGKGSLAVAHGGHETISFNYGGAIIRCQNAVPYILFHEFIHVMDYAHDYKKVSPNYDVAIVLGKIMKSIYYATKMPKIPKSCYEGNSTHYDCS